MSNYPRIYSISTVGVRQHENADYLIHPVRTDFTGNNGLGKSQIADLLQLIFIPLREEWKPGTTGLDGEDRKIEKIPLERDWINHAYCFLNIEKTKGKFLTIGVCIPRTSRIPIRPFIIQKGDNFENKNILLTPFEDILTSNDFIDDSLKIFDLSELKRHLQKKYNIYLKDFYQREQVNDYFDFLAKNKILTIDLTKESNLKSFSKVLQSFSRANTLKTDDSKSLQNFLFEDDKDINAAFDSQKEILTEHISNYQRADNEIKTLKEKQGKLSALKETSIKYEKAKESYLSKSAHFLSTKKHLALKEYNENEAKKDKANNEYTKAKNLYQEQCKGSYQLMLELKELCNEIRQKLEEEVVEAGKQNIEKLKNKLDTDKKYVSKLEELSPLIKKHSAVPTILEQYERQEKIKEQKKKLRSLRESPLYSEFKVSKWVEGYEGGYNYYNERTASIKDKLETLEEVLSLYKGDNSDSLLNWAIQQKTALTIEQETVIMAFKDISTKRIESSKGKIYSLNPKALMNSFEVNKDGIWIILGDISEFYPLVPKQLFKDKDNLEKAITNDSKKIEQEIKDLKTELRGIEKLNEILIKIGLNQELIDIYNGSTEIDSYELEIKLTEENIHFIENNFGSFSLIDNLKEDTKKLDEKITEILKRTNSIEYLTEGNDKILKNVLENINDLKHELPNPDYISQLNIKELQRNELIKIRDEKENALNKIEKIRNQTKRKRDEQKSIFDGATILAKQLSTDKTNTENEFNDAKTLLEKETELLFENLLPLGSLSESIIKKELETYTDLKDTYKSEYVGVASLFEESNPSKKSPELYKPDGVPYYSYQTLENILCGKIGLNGLTKELDDLNQSLKSLGDLQLKILTEVFTLVENQYKAHEDTIRRLNFFFDKNKVSDIYNFKIEFEPRKDINIDWIEKMKAKTRVHRDGASLFTLPEDMPSKDNTPENLIKGIAATFYGSANADTTQLLDPKFYFKLKVRMKDEEGKTNSGSGGQAYTALALLCIGRLSIVQKNQVQNPGIKFIIIEELSNIDDTNFNIFPDIAKEFGYQLITMTPKPFGSYTNEEWYLHMLVRGKKDKDRNYTPMSFFKTKYKNVELGTYTKEQNELESVQTV